MFLPSTWRQALTNSAVVTGGTTEPLAVGPAGEIAASYESGTIATMLPPDGSSQGRTGRLRLSDLLPLTC